MHLESLTVITQLNAIHVAFETHATNATQLTQFMVQVVVTSESARAIDQLRRACGGHGFMASSNLPCKGCVFLLFASKLFKYISSHKVQYSHDMEQKYTSLPCIFGMVTAACTYEGENTVLMLQIARWPDPSTSSSKNVFSSDTW